MYSRAFIEAQTVYVHDGAMDCAECGERAIEEAKDRQERETDRAVRFIEGGKETPAADAARNAARAAALVAELEDSATLDDGESDSPRSCDSCHCFIDGALTSDGAQYVAESIRDSVQFDDGSRAVVKEWAETYFPDSDLPARILSPEQRAAILATFARVDRVRRAVESIGRMSEAAARPVEAGRLSGAAAALRAAWVRFTYGGDSVRETLRGANR